MKYLFIPVLFIFASVARARTVVLPRTGRTAEDDEDPFVILSDKLAGFEVCGVDGVFHPADAKIFGSNKVEVSSDVTISEVRYAFKDFPLCNLFNSYGLPARPFRTDKQPPTGLGTE